MARPSATPCGRPTILSCRPSLPTPISTANSDLLAVAALEVTSSFSLRGFPHQEWHQFLERTGKRCRKRRQREGSYRTHLLLEDPAARRWR